MILYSYPLYRVLSSPLKIFERRTPYRESDIDTFAETGAVDVILVGLGNYGSGLMEHLLRRNNTIAGIDFDPGTLDKWRKRGVPVLYGDMADPEMHEQLPLKKARWFISTVRSKELNLALIHNLKKDGYTGKIALTASNSQEAAEFEKAGANLVFRPFMDATEQAVDALTYAMDFLPESVDWPISFLELRIRSDASAAGQTIRELPLSSLGISILAISRGGRISYEPTPEFRIFPSDRLLLMGHPDGLKEAENILNQLKAQRDAEDKDRFEIAEIKVSADSGLSGKSLAELHFRQRFGATLVGIRRDQEQITTINPAERLHGGDCLIVIGKAGAIKELKNLAPLKW
ncbi:MAG: NAD-binding protein, partial [Syntrophaceae bacterium]|nr:NAD-binding protein [Syntrophaceae bacterium]